MTTKTDIQIRFADVDMLQHVNNVNLQHYFDMGKSSLFKAILNSDLSWTETGVITAATNTNYLEQTRLDDNIYVESGIEKLGQKSITVYQRIVNRVSGKVHADSRSVMVCYNFPSQQSVSIPDIWSARLKTYSWEE